MRTIHPILPFILGFFLSGCGKQEPQIIIEETGTTESVEPDAAPGTEKTPNTSPSASASASPGPAVVATPRRTRSLSFVLDWDDKELPLLVVELSSKERGVKVTDVASADGLGLNRRFSALDPGEYLMRVTAPVLNDPPLLERSIDLTEDRLESFRPAMVRLVLPEERSFEVPSQFGLTLTEEPSMRPLLKRKPLSELSMETRTGRKIPTSFLLPYGKYSFSVDDIGKDPSIGFTGIPDGAVADMGKNSITLSPDNPSYVIDLKQMVRVQPFVTPVPTPIPTPNSDEEEE